MKPAATIKWGLVGYGDLPAKRLAAALREASGSELRGVWGRNHATTLSFAAQQNIPEAHASFASLITSAVDAIYVCTPPDSHAEYALAAMEAGKHVLVEKPMAAAATDCERMVEVSRRRGVKLGVAYYRRSFPKAQKIKALIADGLLGIPTWVNIACHSWFNPAMSDPKGWRVRKVQSGGAGPLADIGVHRLDLLEYWLGPARLIFSDLQHLVQSYEVEDGATLVLKLANGAPVSAYFSWSSKTFLDRFEIVGSEGKIIADPLDGPNLTVIRGRDREDLRIEPPANAHLACVEDFVRAVQEKREPLCTGADGLRINQLLAQMINGVAA